MKRDYREEDLGNYSAGAKYDAIKENEGKEVLVCDRDLGWVHGSINLSAVTGDYLLVNEENGESSSHESHDLETLLILGESD